MAYIDVLAIATWSTAASARVEMASDDHLQVSNNDIPIYHFLMESAREEQESQRFLDSSNMGTFDHFRYVLMQ